MALAFADLVNHPVYHDVTFLVGPDQQEFHAYKGILGARCEYFDRMFSIGMRESSQCTVQLPEIQPVTFLALLRFLYTDETPVLTVENVVDIWAAADMYGVLPLQTECDRVFCRLLTVDSVCAATEAALTRRADTMYQRCLLFAADNLRPLHHRGSLLRLSLQAMQDLLRIPHIWASEVAVFRAVLAWGVYQWIVQRDSAQALDHPDVQALLNATQSLPTIEAEVADVLAPLVPMLRLTCISPAELQQVVEPAGVVPVQALLDAYRHFAVSSTVVTSRDSRMAFRWEKVRVAGAVVLDDGFRVEISAPEARMSTSMSEADAHPRMGLGRAHVDRVFLGGRFDFYLRIEPATSSMAAQKNSVQLGIGLPSGHRLSRPATFGFGVTDATQPEPVDGCPVANRRGNSNNNSSSTVVGAHRPRPKSPDMLGDDADGQMPGAPPAVLAYTEFLISATEGVHVMLDVDNGTLGVEILGNRPASKHVSFQPGVPVRFYTIFKRGSVTLTKFGSSPSSSLDEGADVAMDSP